MKRNRTLFSVFLLCSLILFGCLEENPYLHKYWDPRLDGWWRSESQDSLNPAVSAFYHFDVKKGTKTEYNKYENGRIFRGDSVCWHTETNTAGNLTEDQSKSSYDGILHTYTYLFGTRKEIGTGHYYRLKKDSVDNVDILEISVQEDQWFLFSQVIGWQTLKRIPKPEQFNCLN